MKFPVYTIALIAAAGCTPSEEDTPEEPIKTTPAPTPEATPEAKLTRFTLGSQDYAVPKEHIPAIRLGGDKSFIKIKVPGFPAEIVYDAQSAGLTDKIGAPQIFSINDRDYPSLQYSDRRDGQVVCRSGMAAQTGCGTKFAHAGSEWTLLFPHAKRLQADRLVTQAKKRLDRYVVNPASEPVAPDAGAKGDPGPEESSKDLLRDFTKIS